MADVVIYMFIRTITFHNTITTMLELAKFLTIRERRRFESISTGNLFLTQTQADQIISRLRSPLVQLKSTFRGFAQRRTIRGNQLPGRSGLACPWAHVWLSTHPYYHLECALLQNGAYNTLGVRLALLHLHCNMSINI